MSNRTDRLAGAQLAIAVDNIEHKIEELKNGVQYISGSNIVYFTSQLPGDYDWQDTIPDPGGLGFGGKLFLVEAEATSMEFLWAGLRIDLYKGSPPVMYRGDSVFADMVALTDWFSPSVYDVPNDSGDPRLKSWYVSITGPAGVSAPLLSIKFIVDALDEVNITITELN
jgi:hypothetical protein